MLSIDEQISLLLWDRRLVIIHDKTYHIKNTPIGTKNRAIALKEQTYRNAISEGVSTEADLIQDAIASDLLPYDYNDRLVHITEQVEHLSESLKNQKHLIKKKKMRTELEKLKAQHTDIIEQKGRIYMMSAEYMAQETYIYNLMIGTILDDEEKPIWSNLDSLYQYKQQDPTSFNAIIHEFLNNQIWEQSTLRIIARSFEWRLMWNLCKENLSQLFNGPLTDINSNQKMLIYWSRVYDSVYEDPNKPSEDIIENDDSLDAWLLERNSPENKKTHVNAKDHQEQMIVLDGYYSESCSCGVAAVKAKGHGEKQQHAVECLYGRYIRYTVEEKEQMAQAFYNKNAPQIRKVINQEQDVIEKVGTIEEQHLRKGKNRHLLGMETKKVK